MMPYPETSLQSVRRSQSGQRLVSRKPRFPFSGTVRVLLDFDPWRLMFHLNGINISETGLLAVLQHPTGAMHGSLPLQETARLFSAGDPYVLQIEHDCQDLAAPVLSARLRLRRDTASGIELAFAFDRMDADLTLLIDELGHRSHGQ